jgi:anti-anti-sigma regulatory factor
MEAQPAALFQPNREPTMVKVRYDRKRNTVIVEFEGNVDAEQAKHFFADLDEVRPKLETTFRLLTDFSLVDSMEFSVKGEIEKAMDLFNAQGVTEIIRVIPDANMDIGFNLMSAAHYSKQIKVHTVRSRQQAEAHLGSEKTD